ncbi:MAG: hypothetical protein H6528_04000 [Actinobacteria bacterium]|nr:hypothetical protein [Actinomycetota bacterium]
MDDRLTIANVDIHATILQAAGLPNTSAGTSMIADRNSDGVPLFGAESTSRVVRPPFCAWRTREDLFVRYGSGEGEFYDYRVDPHELDNRIGDPPTRPASSEVRGTRTGGMRRPATGLRADLRSPAVASGARRRHRPTPTTDNVKVSQVPSWFGVLSRPREAALREPERRSSRIRTEIGILVRDPALRLALYGRGTLTNLPPTNQDADV